MWFAKSFNLASGDIINMKGKLYPKEVHILFKHVLCSFVHLTHCSLCSTADKLPYLVLLCV
jgi:hypothetical protein